MKRVSDALIRDTEDSDAEPGTCEYVENIRAYRHSSDTRFLAFVGIIAHVMGISLYYYEGHTQLYNSNICDTSGVGNEEPGSGILKRSDSDSGRVYFARFRCSPRLL